MFNQKNNKRELTNEQKEILKWLYFHQLNTAQETWEMLFKERGSKMPDRCIAMYDNLSFSEKAEVEYIFSEHYYQKINLGNSTSILIKCLSTKR